MQTTSDCDSDIHQEIATQGTFLAILKGDNISESGNKNMSMAFTVDDVDKEYLRLIEMGIDIIDPSTVRPWGAKNMRFQDIEGNYIVFRSFVIT